jgi:hypothetical protein
MLHFFQISLIPHEHEYMSIGNLVNKMASAHWVSERVVAWLRKRSSLGAADLQDKLLEKYGVEVAYNTIWEGRKKAMDLIYGAWEDSFESLFSFGAELMHRSPGSIFEIATKPTEDGGVMFDKVFVTMKPCVDGFIQGVAHTLGLTQQR